MVSFSMVIVGERKLILLGNASPQKQRLSKRIWIVESSQNHASVQRKNMTIVDANSRWLIDGGNNGTELYEFAFLSINVTQ
jgi:hypothetical protein